MTADNLTIENGVLISHSFPSEAEAHRITIPDGTKSIAEGMFRGDQNVVSVTIPNSVTSIDEATFQSCTGLDAIVVPGSYAAQYAAMNNIAFVAK